MPEGMRCSAEEHFFGCKLALDSQGRSNIDLLQGVKQNGNGLDVGFVTHGPVALAG